MFVLLFIGLIFGWLDFWFRGILYTLFRDKLYTPKLAFFLRKYFLNGFRMIILAGFKKTNWPWQINHWKTVMIKEIICVKSQEVSNKQIARAIKSSRTTVIKYLKLFEATGLSLEVLDGMPDEDLQNHTQIQDEPVVAINTTRHAQLLGLFPVLEKQLSNVGATRINLWRDYKNQYCAGYGYSQFSYHLHQCQQQSLEFLHLSGH